MRKHGYLQSREKILKLTNRSLLPQIRDLRETLTAAEVEAWKAAAAAGRQNWWNLFVQDTSYRLKYGISGLATPSTLHQYKVGRVQIAGTADRVLLTQYHPEKYWINKKVKGNTSLREDVAVYEPFSLPLTIGMSYRSNLSQIGPEPKARFYAVVFSSYQGRTIETELNMPLEYTTGWTRSEVSLTDVTGLPRYYQLFIELEGLQGSFEWDNVLSEHSGMNWARDWRCSDVNNELTRANWQIEKSWEELYLPFGAAFDSVYPSETALP